MHISNIHYDTVLDIGHHNTAESPELLTAAIIDDAELVDDDGQPLTGENLHHAILKAIEGDYLVLSYDLDGRMHQGSPQRHVVIVCPVPLQLRAFEVEVRAGKSPNAPPAGRPTDCGQVAL
jgi:hypothetical protein